MGASKAILFEHDTLLIRPEQDQLLENLVHMVKIYLYSVYYITFLFITNFMFH